MKLFWRYIDLLDLFNYICGEILVTKKLPWVTLNYIWGKIVHTKYMDQVSWIFLESYAKTCLKKSLIVKALTSKIRNKNTIWDKTISDQIQNRIYTLSQNYLRPNGSEECVWQWRVRGWSEDKHSACNLQRIFAFCNLL